METPLTADDLSRQGIEQHQAGNLPAAESFYRHALSLAPEHPTALHYLGLLSCQAGNVAPGLVLLERSVQLRPDNARFHNNLGNVYRAAGRRDKAVAAYRRSLRLDPRSTLCRINLGIILWEIEQHDAGLGQLEQALRSDGRHAEAQLALGSIYKDLGRIDDALLAYEKAAKLGNGATRDIAHNSRLYTLNFHPGNSPGQIFDAHRAWAAEHADPLAVASIPPPTAEDSAHRLKVGYVSSNFRSHAVNFFMEPILLNHNRARFEITCYSDVSAPDAVTSRLGAMVERWCHTVGLSDEELTRQIRADGINILVDLSGHMGTNRLMAFARKPAPVQVTYLGYQATTGMAAMDYRITDAYSDPPGQTDAWHTEKLVRLPQAFFCYRPPEEAPEAVDPPCLKSRTVTFGSFNIFAKVTPAVLVTWAKILGRVPGSRLQLLVPDSGSLRQRVLGLMADHKINAKRIVFVPRAARREYLGRFQTVDIALDPFPFNSHTTSCDALWMGVPTVMLAGQSYVQRYGGVALVCLDLQNLIADTPEAYIETAVHWAMDHARLTVLRKTLRERMRASIICDAVGFTRRLEDAYHKMWRTYCDHKPPQEF